jgi:hypothetical protein
MINDLCPITPSFHTTLVIVLGLSSFLIKRKITGRHCIRRESSGDSLFQRDNASSEGN